MTYAVKIDSNQQRAQAKTRSGHGSFTAGMARSNNNKIENLHFAFDSTFTALQAMLAESRPAAEPADDDGLGTFNPLNQTYTFREKTIENADSVLGTAIRSAIRNRRISATLLVTELEIGYTRASKILYQLEELGIIVQQPDNHANPWRVVENGDEGEGAAADEEAAAK